MKLRIFNSKRGGWECQDTPEGGKHCVRFEADKQNQKFATGTEITLTADQNCKAVIGGDVSSIMDEDEDRINNLAKKVELKCKRDRGLA